MNKELAGTLFIRQGVALDYCFEASIRSMQAICDHVFIVYVDSDDNTLEVLITLLDANTTLLKCKDEQWRSHHGKEKLSFFQNIGIEYANRQGYEYVFLCQGDCVIHEDSFPFIKQAIELGEESYFVSRYNLWGSKDTMLNVPQNRKPVSTVVNRLAKSCYLSVDDGENISANPASLDFINLIQIFHMGFIRDPKKHVAKIKEIQGNIFEMDVDSRVKDAETFDPFAMGFTKEDLIPIPKSLPKFVLDWAKNK